MLLDADLIRRRREELGHSVRSAAAAIGVVGSVIQRIETGDNHPDLTGRLIFKLAKLLAVEPSTLWLPLLDEEGPDDEQVEQEDRDRDDHGEEVDEHVDVEADDEADVEADAQRLGALLHAASTLTPKAALREALAWDQQRLDAASTELERRLGACGLRLNRNPHGLAIANSVEAGASDAVKVLARAHVIRDGLNVLEASMLRRLSEGTVPADPSNPQRVALGALANAGLTQLGTAPTKTAQRPVELTDEVRFSLMLDER